MSKSKAKSKSSDKGEWKTKTLAEVTTSDGVKWRAQLSIAPDKTKFAGIRKIAVKKDGTEIVTRDGLTFKYDASTIGDEVDAITGLLQALKGGKIKAGEQSTDSFVLFDPRLKRALTGCSSENLGTAREGKKPKVFTTSADAKAYREKLTNGDTFKVKRHG